MKALVIGRFQIVHKGHESMFRQMKNYGDIEKIIAGIGIAKEIGTRKNPFNGEEVKEMLEPMLESVGLPYEICFIPDINDPPNYEKHVKNIIGYDNPIEILIVSGNPYTTACFEGKGYKIIEPDFKGMTSATEIRKRIVQDEEWEHLVPESTIEFLNRYGGVDKLKKIFGTYTHNYRNPIPTTDIIIHYNNGIVLVERKNPPYGWAIPGGFAEKGLSFEENAKKEAKEETGLDILIKEPARPFGVYSDPKRDPRGHMVSTVFVAEGCGELKAGDDAKNARVFSADEIKEMIEQDSFPFDHGKILSDYLERGDNE